MSARTTSETSLRAQARERVWDVAVRAAAVLAMPTSGRRPLPDFLIVGAQRCGTTSLHHYLLQHPAVVGPRWSKGVHWFDTDYAHRDAWYRAHFPTAARRERIGRRAGTRAVVGESSPYYLFHPYGAARMAAELPDTKFIALLRDPVERARSHHEHEVARGFETLPFEEALDREDERLAGAQAALAPRGGLHHSHQHHAYVARGRYAEQLARLFDAVGRDRVLVVFTAELDRDTQGTVATVHRFLGLPVREVVTGRRWNVRRKPAIDPATLDRLRATFAPHDVALRDLLGRDLPWRSDVGSEDMRA
jgi:hypothetical protein